MFTALIAMFLSLTFPQIVKTVENEQKLNWYNFFAVVMVGAYIGMTTWFQRKIAENIKNKMDDYNEELAAMNDELQHHMEREIQYKLKEEMMIQQKKQSEKTVNALAYTIDSKDRYTSGHSQRVAKYSLELARRMGKVKMNKRLYIKRGYYMM